jgi:hypothetical protein
LYYLPNIEYLSAIACATTICIEQFENYQKRSFRNRCFINTAQGTLQLSIPLQSGKNEQQAIREVKIDNQQAWQRQHWRSLVTAYNAAPFWEYYADSLILFYQKKYDFLWDWNIELLTWLLDKIKIKTEICFTNAYKIESAATSSHLQNYQKAQYENFTPKVYPQLFGDFHNFLPNLTSLDALFCMGNLTGAYLKSCR